MMEEIIDVDNDKFKLQCIVPDNIDCFLLEKQQCISQVQFKNNIQFELAPHLEQMRPTKRRRLNYHKLKQFICTK